MGKYTFWSLAIQVCFLLATSFNLVAGQPKEENLNIVNLSSDKRPSTDLIVLHDTGTDTVEQALVKLDATRNATHYIVAKNGTIFRWVLEENRAWHLGTGGWKNISEVNERSISIYMVNKFKVYPQSQLKAVFGLISNLRQRYNIRILNIVGARDVSLGTELDPSYLFPWKDLYAHMGVFDGLYKTNLTKEEQKQILLEGFLHKNQDVYNKLRRIGYGNEKTKFQTYNRDRAQMIFNFNAHFCTEAINERMYIDAPHLLFEAYNWYKICDERADYLLAHDN